MAGALRASPSRRSIPGSGLIALVAMLAAMLLGPAAAEPKFPELTDRVVDEAGLLSGQDYAALVEELKALEDTSTDQVAVVTLKSLQGYPIEDFGYQLGRKWGIGQKGKDNGILLIVAPNERKVRIEVGRGLEPVMTDAMSKLIIENAILPAFRRGDYPGGIRAGVRDIKDVLLGDAEAVKERAKTTRARLGIPNAAAHSLPLLDGARPLHHVGGLSLIAFGAAGDGRTTARHLLPSRQFRQLGRGLVERRGQRRRRRLVGRRRRLRRRRLLGKLVGDGSMKLFSTEDEARVSQAITQAERKTSGEIVVVVAARSDAYLYVPPLVGALLSLLVPWVLIYFTGLSITAIYLTQLGVFLVVTTLLLPVPVRTALVPLSVKKRHAHQRALEQFLVQNLHTTEGHTGVLIFVSVAEHHVEILADRAIDARVPEGTWKAIIDELTAAIARGQPADGLVAAIAAAGEHLGRHFPPEARNPNELPDHLIVLQ